MTRRIVGSFALAFAGMGLVAAPAAHADVAPPPGYVEQCTLEKQTTPELECISCSTHHEAAEACVTEHAPNGYTKRCSTRGATAWTEIHCRPKAGGDKPAGDEKPAGDDKPAGEAKPATEAPAPAAEPAKSKCAGADLEGSAGLLVALGALLVLRRRRLTA